MMMIRFFGAWLWVESFLVSVNQSCQCETALRGPQRSMFPAAGRSRWRVGAELAVEQFSSRRCGHQANLAGAQAGGVVSDRLLRDRRDAGRSLAGLLERYRGCPEVVVAGISPGGVPVAFEVAKDL